VKEKLQQEDKEKRYVGYQLRVDNMLMYNKRLYVPNSIDLRKFIMDEFHRRPYVGHPSYQKMVTIVRKLYYCPRMKQYIACYILKCLECQQVKVEHRHPARLLQPIHIPEWKCVGSEFSFSYRSHKLPTPVFCKP
jgi:hypothetical protein